MKQYQKLTVTEQLAYRKRRELWRKLNALGCELDSWLARSEPNGPFEKHHTQIRAVRTHLGQWSQTVRSLVKKNLRGDTDAFLASIYNAERLILSEHRIWEFFRGKLVQRDEEGFRRYLAIADEFAWACYSPIQAHVYADRASPSCKEPPLVFFNGGTSPFSSSRGKDFKPEEVRIAGEDLSGRDIELASKLPIPVVGLPWHQIAHLPEALVIGHEVGHLVEDDFGLTDGLQSLLLEGLAEAKAETRQGAWVKWLGEIFADIYGCLSAGPAFVGALMDFLARDYAEISFERKTEKDWSPYPTTYLRGLILLNVLEEMGFPDKVAGYRSLWDNFKSKMPREFSDDVPFIVRKLLNGNLIKSTAPGVPAASVKEIFCFSRAQQDVVDRAVKLGTKMAVAGSDIRVLFATARAAYEADPKTYIRENYGAKILTHIEKNVIRRGIRRKELPLTFQQIEEKLRGYEESARSMVDEVLRESDASLLRIQADANDVVAGATDGSNAIQPEQEKPSSARG
ncbi:MAG: hypothetical protein DMF67_05910 [Acidobacteria bacterium]|nr:MAG: hypothetical protein DMF67_05910 [Acidobacteriota bacterium]